MGRSAKDETKQIQQTPLPGGISNQQQISNKSWVGGAMAKKIQRGISQRTKLERQGNRNDCNGPKRTREEALLDRCELAKMDIFRTSQAELARRLNSMRTYSVTQQTISRDLGIIKAEMAKIQTSHKTATNLFKKKYFRDPNFTKIWLSMNSPYLAKDLLQGFCRI